MAPERTLGSLQAIYPENALNSAEREQTDRVAEGIVATSLFEQHANTVVTIRGVTGTLEALGSLCPKDLSEEPPEAVHKWTLDVLTESGVELTDEDRKFIPPPNVEENIQKKN